MFSAYRSLFSSTKGGPGKRERGGEEDRMADDSLLSEISRCRPHKSTVDTAVGRASALVGSGSKPPSFHFTSPRLVSSHPSGDPPSRNRSSALRPPSPPSSARIHILKVIYCRITLTAQPGPKRIKETPLSLSLSSLFLSPDKTPSRASPG